MNKPDKVRRQSTKGTISSRKSADLALTLSAELLDNVSDSVLLFDFEGNIFYANETWFKSYGYTRGELSKLNLFRDVVDPEYHRQDDHFQELREKGQVAFESMDFRKDGSMVPVEVRVRTIELGGNKLLLSVIRDISERKRLEEELRLKELMLDKATDSIFLRDFEGNFLYVNEMGAESRGYTREEFLKLKVDQVIVPGYPRVEGEILRQLKENGEVIYETADRCKDGSIRLVEGHPRIIEWGGRKLVFTIVRDITERKKAEEELRLKELLLDNATDAVFLRDMDGKILYANETACRSLGYTRDELLRMNIRQLLSPEDAELVASRTKDILKKGTISFEPTHVRKDGSLFPVEVKVTPIESGGKTLLLSVSRDITERKRMEAYIKQLAYHDTLTGLPNRTLFNDRFTLALAHAVRYRHKLALLMMDLDHFKDINDSLGHEAGDSLLKEVGKRLTGIVRKVDTVSRMGGDEFVMLLPEVKDEEDAVSVAKKIVEGLRQPFVLMGSERTITTSVGIAIYPSDGNDLDALLRSADNAMYQAKKAGRNSYAQYSRNGN